MRNLIDVINAIVEVAPELEVHFKPLIESTRYTAPELMYLRWNHAAAILNEHYHPKRDEISAIFSGQNDE